MKTLRLLLKKLTFCFSLILLIIITLGATGPGTIYIVIGSDTAIWDNMNTANYNCTYNPALFINPDANANKVMDPSFRGRMKDSFGDTLSLTWWMMAGNIFRYSVNTNIPYPNIMTMYLMKEYYGENIKILGDELSLHYHTFKWTDYDGDGKYWWNQAHSFMDTYDDFNFTLAQLFLEEEVFPVSFRSGWHFMDNGWQNYLNKLLPYSLHNDYPSKRTSDPEPIDNIFDWSQSSSDFIPFNPSPDNYQVQGDSKGWNVRSIHLNSFKNNNTLINSIFNKANSGTDQLVCIWGHLPEVDFNDNLEKIDSVLHKYESLYPGVKFKYSTGTEAYQLYRQGTDFTPPSLNVQETLGEGYIDYFITTDEPIFQEQPFVAYKDIDENFLVAECTPLNNYSWTVHIPLSKDLVAKAGVVLTDTLGNQAIKIIRYLPDDQYKDNTSPGYSEQYGNWVSNSAYAWKHDSRQTGLSQNDSAKAVWNFSITNEGFYHISTQFPKTTNHAGKFTFYIKSDSEILDTINFQESPEQKKWIYLSTMNFLPGNYIVELTANGNNQEGKVLTADVIKISPLVREKAIQFPGESINLGEVALEDSIFFEMEIRNNGTESLTLSDVQISNNKISAIDGFPIIVPSMSVYRIKMKITSESVGLLTDTLVINSDDPLNPSLRIPFTAVLKPYFVVVDNEDAGNYFETSGNWAQSVAQAYGATSRFAYVSQNPRASAYFEKRIPKTDNYFIQFIVPATINAATRALYKIYVEGFLKDSIIVDQNLNSGGWVILTQLYIDANNLVKIEVSDPGGNPGGVVLRTDAFKIGVVDESLSAEESEINPSNYFLYQNYPNPFNPVTKIKYNIPSGTNQVRVNIRIYDIIGRTVATLVDEMKSPGMYEASFDGSHLSSGVYFCKINADAYSSVIKMVLMK